MISYHACLGACYDFHVTLANICYTTEHHGRPLVVDVHTHLYPDEYRYPDRAARMTLRFLLLQPVREACVHEKTLHQHQHSLPPKPMAGFPGNGQSKSTMGSR